MFYLIDNLAILISKLICKNDDSSYEYIYYGITGYLYFLFSLSVSIICGLYLGYVQYVFLSTGILVFIRKFCGGTHSRKHKYSKYECLFLNVFFVFVICYSTNIQNVFGLFYLIVFLLSHWCFFGLKKLPRYSKDAKQHSRKQQRVIRDKYITTLHCFYMFNWNFVFLTLFNYNDFSKLSIIISMSFLVVRLCLTDFMYSIFDK